MYAHTNGPFEPRWECSFPHGYVLHLIYSPSIPPSSSTSPRHRLHQLGLAALLEIGFSDGRYFVPRRGQFNPLSRTAHHQYCRRCRGHTIVHNESYTQHNESQTKLYTIANAVLRWVLQRANRPPDQTEPVHLVRYTRQCIDVHSYPNVVVLWQQSESKCTLCRFNQRLGNGWGTVKRDPGDTQRHWTWST